MALDCRSGLPRTNVFFLPSETLPAELFSPSQLNTRRRQDFVYCRQDDVYPTVKECLAHLAFTETARLKSQAFFHYSGRWCRFAPPYFQTRTEYGHCIVVCFFSISNCRGCLGAGNWNWQLTILGIYTERLVPCPVLPSTKRLEMYLLWRTENSLSSMTRMLDLEQDG